MWLRMDEKGRGIDVSCSGHLPRSSDRGCPCCKSLIVSNDCTTYNMDKSPSRQNGTAAIVRGMYVNARHHQAY